MDAKYTRGTQHTQNFSPLQVFLWSLTCNWSLINGEILKDFQAVDGSGRVWAFRCSIRKKGHPKPVISKGWLAFVHSKSLKVGDKVQLLREKNEAGAKTHAYEIRAEKEIKIFGAVFGYAPII
ncbi:hypothetical protein H0E87_026264 [Populus deltoides]|uniref:TF-B3 domain-containing protein n=1 Tax=Populus deltoides TaxID=3696 RepID=A0A8T2X5F0_POPDE|nr:hypothetical protein H0E87_026264 [Populus deltoides]